MTESAVLLVEHDLAEDGLRLYRAPAPVVQSLLREKEFPCLPLVTVEPVVDVDGLGPPQHHETSEPERASLSVGGRVLVKG